MSGGGGCQIKERGERMEGKGNNVNDRSEHSTALRMQWAPLEPPIFFRLESGGGVVKETAENQKTHICKRSISLYKTSSLYHPKLLWRYTVVLHFKTIFYITSQISTGILNYNFNP